MRLPLAVWYALAAGGLLYLLLRAGRVSAAPPPADGEVAPGQAFPGDGGTAGGLHLLSALFGADGGGGAGSAAPVNAGQVTTGAQPPTNPQQERAPREAGGGGGFRTPGDPEGGVLQ